MGGDSPFIGMLLLVPYNFAPRSWQFCDGSALDIGANGALFSLIGTTYGGDGQTTFNIPDLQGRSTIHQGQGPGLSPYVIGEKAGFESVTLITSQYPSHTHGAFASSQNQNSSIPLNNSLGAGVVIYTATAPDAQMAPVTIGSAFGGSQPHDNRQPYLGLNWVISLEGIFPSRG